MRPTPRLITIDDNVAQAQRLLSELVIQPRILALQWARITRQTPNLKVGYPGQHLVSLVTGMEGERTGARGNDLIDGSEVKSCSRIDALDKCLDCKAAVARIEIACPVCESGNILRSNDSKWLFTIRSENDLDVLTRQVQRVILVLSDYPNFEEEDFETLRFQVFEIWTGSERCTRFSELMSNYYANIYLAHRAANAAKTPAPKNFWPYSYQFYLCNPILTYSCIVSNSTTNPEFDVIKYVAPGDDREDYDSEIMPLSCLTESELMGLIDDAELEELQAVAIRGTHIRRKNELLVPERVGKRTFVAARHMLVGIDETLRSRLPLRDTDKPVVAGQQYARRRA